MKTLLLILTLLLSLSATAQSFKLQANTNRADLDICQENHNRILKKFSDQADAQIAKLLMGLQIEEDLGTLDYKLDQYKFLLGELLIKRIMLSELTKQLNTHKFSTFFSAKENYKKSILNPDAINLDLLIQNDLTIDNVIRTKNLRITKSYLSDLKTTLVKDALFILISKRFRKIGAGILARIVTNQTGKVTTSAVLKSVTMSFGSKLFVSMGTGILIDLLTFPLHAYRLPAESLWTELLADYPELIIVPEWMKKGGIDDDPWMAHCNAIQRRTKEMEKYLKKSLMLDENDYISRIASIYNYEEPKVETPSYYHPYVTPIDNTYVKKYVPREIDLAPRWAYKLN